jgi:hypothetical protein
MSEQEVSTRSPSLPEIEATGLGRSPRRLRLAGYAVGVMLVIGVTALIFWLVSSTHGIFIAGDPGQLNSSTVPAALQRPAVSEAGLVEKVGVRIVQVAVTGGGGLIDLRYQVVDPDKAVALHDDDIPPALIDDTTGVVVDQLLMGHSHTGEFASGQTYYLIFENPGNLVQRGSTLSVLLGNAQVDHVPVQ